MRSLILGIVLNTCIQSWSVPGLQIVECLAKTENGKKVRRKRGPERQSEGLERANSKWIKASNWARLSLNKTFLIKRKY